jgi:glycosyltransferase involved in cell wall biosynthesis
MIPVSVVIPYFNEQGSLLETFRCLEAQTMPPTEIIFVDSGSSDNSAKQIDLWLANTSLKSKIINLRAMTGVPSSSKNAGVRVATQPFIAFMDCGLIFQNDWLELQYNFLQRTSLQVVSGFVLLQGEGLLDRTATAQTYGYLRKRPVVPGTFLNRSVFDTTGFFLDGLRAGYDVDWITKLKVNGIERGLNDKVVTRYLGLNYTSSLSHLFRKVRNYAAPCVGLTNYSYPYYYLALATAVLLIFALSPKSILFFGPLYLLGRGIIIPIVKSKGVQIFRDEPFAFLSLPLIGFIMDLAKLIGYIQGVTQLIILRRPLRNFE